ncbi:MAG: c-type cytochrome [Acidobacteria bacterium]|nr:c-type cytochrome [Acidobacteriota bacterium]
MPNARRVITGAAALVAAVWVVSIGSVLDARRDAGPQQPSPAKPTPWADFVEPGFPFISSVLDARALGAGWPADNLTPRALILNLGHGLWAAFDTDLLRVSAVWSGSGVTPHSMAQTSYHNAGERAPIGQGRLPAIAGTAWLATGLYPGWQRGITVSRVDPRPPAPDPGELGRGPLARDYGHFTAVRLTTDGVVLEYEVNNTPIEEHVVARSQGNGAVVERHFRVGRRASPLTLIVGQRPQSAGPIHTVVAGSNLAGLDREQDGLMVVRIRSGEQPVTFTVAVSPDGAPAAPGTLARPAPAQTRWPRTVNTSGTLSASADAFVVDRIAIPDSNPWRRNVRFADVAFPAADRAALVTFDGDVWAASGLDGNLQNVVWRRFTSGLHEPLSIASRDGALFVFDRNGIWRLDDTDGNGEADRHVLIANVFVQTAETREFAMSMRIAPDGAFIIAKGGQVGNTRGRHNGSVLRITPDGSSSAVLGWGLRQPFASVDPETGTVVASDQQGNYVPATPLHIVRDGQYYGFLPDAQPKEQYPAPIADPLAWIPHAVSASASGQVWLAGSRMGPLNGALVYINYYRPGLLLTRIDTRTDGPRAAVTSLTNELTFAPLAGAVNPADGQLYVTGFRIWGTDAGELSGLARLRYTGAPSTLPHEVLATDRGVLVRFDTPIDRQIATDPSNFSAERWNYQRTSAYGSPHFRLDGTRGQDALVPSSAYVTPDGRGLFIGIPDMRPSMQMRIGWSLATASGARLDGNVYLTPTSLPAFNASAEGFGAITVDLTPRAASMAAARPVTAEEGERIATRMGCLACHSVDGSVTGRVGPSWRGLAGSERVLAAGGARTADAAYLRQSILDPAASVARGFDQADAGMPSYAGVLSDAEIDSVILYIQSLK